MAMALAPAWALDFPARWERLGRDTLGALTVDERGVAYRDGKNALSWAYEDIQRLTLAPNELHVLTYQDQRWKLGADREYRFRAAEGRPFVDAYQLLRGHMDQRLVAEAADVSVKPLWQIPVKRLKTFGGSEGELIVGEREIVYRTTAGADARTWRYEDIENVSSSGSFELTFVSYGGSVRFRLKRPLEEARYNELWRRLNQTRRTQ